MDSASFKYNDCGFESLLAGYLNKGNVYLGILVCECVVECTLEPGTLGIQFFLICQGN